MNDLIKRFKEDLQLSGYAERNIGHYISFVLRLQSFYNKHPGSTDHNEGGKFIKINNYFKTFIKTSGRDNGEGTESILALLSKGIWMERCHIANQLQRIDFFDTTDEESFDISPLYSEIEKDDSDFQKAVEALEKRLILHSLEENQWQRTKTAMMLGLPRKTLFRKMKKFGLE